MTNEEWAKMLKAKLECLKRETSGTDEECNSHNCENCGLNYGQGNMGEQIEALDMAIKALEQEPCEDCVYSTKDGYCQYDDITEAIPPLEPCEDAAAEIKQNFIEKTALENLIDNKSFEITNPFNTYQYIRVVKVADLYDLIEEVKADEDSD